MEKKQSYDRPLLDKLGVKPGHRVSVLRLRDPGFVESVAARGADVSARMRRDSDLVFVAAEGPADLARLAVLRRHIKDSGAIWVVRRKGKEAVLRETDVINAALAAGLVDNKIASFSDTQGAMRLVIRLVDRRT